MTIIRKFYDEGEKEVAVKDAVSCQELTLDGSGKVVEEAWYYTEDNPNPK